MALTASEGLDDVIGSRFTQTALFGLAYADALNGVLNGVKNRDAVVAAATTSSTTTKKRSSREWLARLMGPDHRRICGRRTT